MVTLTGWIRPCKYTTHSQLTWNEVQHELYIVLEKSVKLIDRLNLAREVKYGKLFQISITCICS